MNQISLPSGTSEGDFIHPTLFIVALSGSDIRLGTETRADVGGDPVLLEDSGGGRDGMIHHYNRGQTASGLHPRSRGVKLKEWQGTSPGGAAVTLNRSSKEE